MSMQVSYKPIGKPDGMKYNIEWLVTEMGKENRVKFLFFWGHQKSRSGEITASCFSQWWDSPFIVNNVKYCTSEHWMMSQKALLFEDAETYNKIIMAKSPKEAKELGRQVRNFDELKWNNRRFDIVVEGNLHKFSQSDELKEFLLSTKERVLVEASPLDSIWGIGLASDSKNAENPALWNGLNLLGFALMEVRDLIRKDTGK